MYARVFKRVLDILVAVLALLLFAPLMAAVAAAIVIVMGFPVLYRQPRPGRNEKVFTIFKFRTMLPENDANGRLLTDAERLTPLGSILRETSLDELPEFWNILRGDMSLVGPRPLLTRYLPYYTGDERRRHDVRPGLTGWAQINGRNSLDWDTRLAMDAWYVDHLSLPLDIKIAFSTIGAVISSRDVQVDPLLEPALDEARQSPGGSPNIH